MHLNKRGFSLLEVMIATMVLTIGLLGVAGMQLRALNGAFRSSALGTGAGVAQAGAGWLNGLVGYTDQNKILYFTTGRLYRENFVKLANFDNNATDRLPVTVTLPASIYDIVACFNGQQAFTTSYGQVTLQFRKEGGALFTVQDMPPPAPAGSRIVLTVNANVPIQDMATVSVSVPYTNAFVANAGTTLSFVVASNM